ncbi:hypothetical protein V1525DRAFT_428848 [Lipomyces kononenkoae]|uniref:Uncharacterized protein n=1 Tax=Lipomyces kononenkoae TaxID=34357 RepID=A0ACC3SR22_LIPKO
MDENMRRLLLRSANFFVDFLFVVLSGKSPEIYRDAKAQQTSSQNAHLKRREQVRRAQRTHRERKEAYVKALEHEVLQLRTNEANILQKNKNLLAEVANLNSILAEHGIQLRSDINSNVTDRARDDYDGFSAHYVTSIMEIDGKPQIHLQQENGDDIFYFSAPAPTPLPTDIDVPPSTSRSLTGVDEICLTNIGTEFVLTLESPCLPHHTPNNPNDPSGHALTASASLLFHAQVEEHSQLRNTWNTPIASLERLLQLSSTLALEDEVTPVQAWNYIRRHSTFNATDLELLGQLTTKLLRHVKCHGFGGVIEKTVLKEAVFELLGVDPNL